jgi:hypothetical protein
MFASAHDFVEDTMAEADGRQTRPFEVFRARDAVDYAEDGVMYVTPATEAQQSGMAALQEAGMMEGSAVKLLYARPGMSLTYVWFRSGFPLPLHSHSADCLYFIVAGSLKIGTEELGPGDGFFLGTDVPYTYVPGEKGVEVLEFRTSDHFDFKALAKNPDYWEKAVASLIAEKGKWPAEATPPSGMKVGQPG